MATVSRVWNEADFVSPDTRQRVAEVAARLGYSPHGAARSLITRTTHALGVLLPDLYGEFFSEIIRGIDHTAQAAGYHILVSSSHDSKDEIDAALRSMRGRVDGMIIMSPDLEARRTLQALQGSFPVVLLNGGAESQAFDTITIENHEGAREMTASSRRTRTPPDRDDRRSAAQLRRGRATARLSDGADGAAGSRTTTRWWCRATSASCRAIEQCSSCSRWSIGRRRSSPPTTRWRSARSARFERTICACPTTWRSPDSTTSRSRAT